MTGLYFAEITNIYFSPPQYISQYVTNDTTDILLTVYCMVSKESVARSRVTVTDPVVGLTAKNSWAG